MKTDNMFVTCTEKSVSWHTIGNRYAVHSATINPGSRSGFNFELKIETDVMGKFHRIWMPESMENGDKSISGRYELGIVNVAKSDIHGMNFAVYNPEPAKPLKQVVEDLVKDSFKPGGSAYAALRLNSGHKFINDALIDGGSITQFYPHSGGVIELRDSLGTVRVRCGVMTETDREVNEKIRKALRCPDGANIVTWAEILAAGYFGEKHLKGGAVEDAIHYKKNGAYSDEALAKILAAIVNDGTNC